MGDGLGASQASVNLWGQYNHPHFKNQETKAQHG